MKRLLSTSFLIACFGFSQASCGPGPGPRFVPATHPDSNAANTGAVRFQFKNLIAGLEEKDAILLIFDRYDHTHAGVVHQVFTAGSDQSITVPDIPPGKYYVTIQCISLHRDRLETIVTVRSQRSETVRIRLTPTEAFSKKGVIIPQFHPDLADLSVVRFKSHAEN